MAVVGPLPRYAGAREVSYVLMRSLDEALAPGKRLMQSILVIAGVSGVIALILAFLIARRLSRPVDRLVDFTQEIGKGKLTARATPSGAKEVRTLARAMNAMVHELYISRRSLAEKERLEREIEIAQNIQTSMLPRNFDVPGLEIAGHMIPAENVGGDYYDVIPVDGGCWIGIGDVAGHGLTAGLEMMMVQSVVSALVHRDPQANPKDLVAIVNDVMYENIRERLRQDEHITFTLLRYRDRQLTYAGAHEEIIVFRAGKQAWEVYGTPGTWLAGMPDVRAVTKDHTISLAPGDVVVLHTDGISEARDATGEQFGSERLCDIVRKYHRYSVAAIRDHVVAAVEAWQVKREDDISLVVLRIGSS